MKELIECSNEYFRCEVKDGIAVIQLHEKAFQIVTELEPCKTYISTLETINKAQDISGLIQINNLEFRDDLAHRQFLESMDGEKPDKFNYLSTLMTRYGNIAGRLANAFSVFSKPMVAGIHGKTSLEYFAIVLPFDFRIATQGTEAIFTNLRMGFPPSGNLAYQLKRFVGSAKATEVFLAGDPLAPSKLLELGLISKLVDAESLERECLVTARKICDQPSVALIATRQMLRPYEHDFQRFMERAQKINKLVLTEHLQK